MQGDLRGGTRRRVCRKSGTTRVPRASCARDQYCDDRDVVLKCDVLSGLSCMGGVRWLQTARTQTSSGDTGPTPCHVSRVTVAAFQHTVRRPSCARDVSHFYSVSSPDCCALSDLCEHWACKTRTARFLGSASETGNAPASIISSGPLRSPPIFFSV